MTRGLRQACFFVFRSALFPLSLLAWTTTNNHAPRVWAQTNTRVPPAAKPSASPATRPTTAVTPVPLPFQPSLRAAILSEIRRRAESDAKNGIPPQTGAMLTAYAGEKAVTAREVLITYGETYDRAKKDAKPGPWDRLRPNVGWIAAGIFFVLLVLGEHIKKTLAGLFNAASERIYNRWAGSRAFRGVALQKYRQSLIDQYRELHIPFRPNRPLNLRDIYVPLRVEGSPDGEKIDSYQAIKDFERLMVTGVPGSGKSMLLKHIALTYAEGRLATFSNAPVPILLEMHRLSDEAQKPLKDHLVAAMGRNGFPRAERFVGQNLQQGTLVLLFDGLDEINSSERVRVVQAIKDLLNTYRRCRAVITCRTAVYNNDFGDTVDQTLQIVEFNDQQMRGFLRSWEIRPPKSIEQLMHTLHDRPPIMALARNPLLLTIIAHLYADTEHVLPHSRAQFYDLTSRVLLQQWHTIHNKFEEQEKRLVLRHLALFFQDSAEERQQDRRSVDTPTVLAQIREVIPLLNRKPDEDRPILREIVERSGLLLSVDGGARCQFAHLTLQEFFAAEELRQNPDSLLRRFQNDPDSWRETVKLWCGLADDSTHLIRQVYATDPVTAFECLADAQKVEPALTDEILDHFKARLGRASRAAGDGQGADTTDVLKEEQAVARAFGVVAADRLRPRGDVVFGFLKDSLSSEDGFCRASAATALSLTNLPQAAETLAERYFDQPDLVRVPLVRMGDLAVPSLASLLQLGIDKETGLRAPGAVLHSPPVQLLEMIGTLLDDLQAIGTPQAAQAMVPLLWASFSEVQGLAAWRLATLLPQPNVEATLRDFPITSAQQREPRINWIWQPFDADEDSALSVIAGRLALLLQQASTGTMPASPPALDPRLVIGVCAVHQGAAAIKQFSREGFRAFVRTELERLGLSDPTSRDLRALLRIAQDRPSEAERHEATETAAPILDAMSSAERSSLLHSFLQEAYRKGNVDSRWHYLMSGLSPELQYDVLNRLMGGKIPTRSHWADLHRPLTYEFKSSWHYRTILFLFGLLSMATLFLIGVALLHVPTRWSWQNFWLLASAVSIFTFWINIWKGSGVFRDSSFDPLLAFVTGPLGSLILPLIFITGIYQSLTGKASPVNEYFSRDSIMALLTVPGFPAIVYFVTTALLRLMTWQPVVLFWLALAAVCVGLTIMGRQMAFRADNPLRGLLQLQTSGIAAPRGTAGHLDPLP